MKNDPFTTNKFLIIVVLLIQSVVLMGQEICDNGIDDDGDGLIDIFDAQECPCGTFVLDEVIGDFEDFTCCPFGPTLAPGSGIYCLDDGWGPANVSTADFFHTCGFTGNGGISGFPDVPMPIPSGEGAVGMWSVGNIIENIGVCLEGAMQPGAMYDLSMYVGFNANDSYESPLDVNVTIFGTPSCGDFPAVGAVGCLQGTQGWEELHTFSVSGAADDTWQYVETSFVSSMGAEAIAFSIACEGNPTLTYHFMDDIHLSGYFLEENEADPIEAFGDCLSGVTLEIPEQPGGTYQWYYEEEPIAGANSNVYLVPSTEFQGVYHVEVLFGGSCALSSPYELFIDAEVLELEALEFDVSCFGDQDGAIELDIQSNNSPFDIEWDNGASTEDIYDLFADQYVVTVTDNYGCIGDGIFFVNQPDLMINNVNVTQPFGLDLGSAIVNTSGGTEPYYYEWSTGLNGEYQNEDEDLLPGIYFVTITDDNGCQQIVDFEIVGIYSVEDTVSISCFGICTGTIDLTIDGPDNDYFIDWDDDSLEGFELTNVCPGSYAYTVTDGDGAPFVGDVLIEESYEIIVNASHLDSLCSADDLTDIHTEVSGGIPPYTYLWSDGSTADSLTNIGIGMYSLEVTDSLLCTELIEFNIYQFTQLEINYEVIPAGCQGENIGAINLIITNGVGPYEYAWDNGELTEDINGLGINDYSVTITDGNMCSYVEVINVGEQAGFEVDESVVHTSCEGASDGSISLQTMGGELPFTFNWSSGQETSAIENLSVGNYSVIVSDAAGCTWTQSFDIMQNSEVNVVAQLTQNDCFGTALGAIDLNISSAAPYELLWDDNSSDDGLSSLTAGDYNLLLTDSFGCEYVYDYTITQGVETTYAASVSDISCYQGQDGEIEVSILTASEPVVFSWSNNVMSATNENLNEGQYLLTITDGLGCEVYDEYNLMAPSDIMVSETIVNNSCLEYEEGSISLEISGGTEPYQISWSNSGNGNLIENLASDTYQVNIQDALGCTYTDDYTVQTLSFLETEPMQIIGPCNNSIHTLSVQASNGIEPYNYLWETGEEMTSINISQDGEYSVTVTDDNGCTSEEIFNINLPTDVIATVVQVIEPSPANDDGYIEISIEGGAEPYDIQWSSGEENVLAISSLGVGEYTVVATDASGCSATLTFTFIANPLEVMYIVAYNPCFGSCVASIETIVSEGVLPYSYEWSNGSTESTIIDLCSGPYQVTITDAIGQVVESNVIEINSPPVINLEGSIYDISCIQSEDGAITVNAMGGTEPFSYDWNINEFTDSIANLSSGVYIVTVADDEGCEESEMYTLDDIPMIDLNATLIPIVCEEETGAIIIEGNNEYDYDIFLNESQIEEDLNATVDDLEAGNYTLSYVVNPNCIIEVDEIEIIPLPEYNLILSLDELTILEKDSAQIELTIEADILDEYSILWDMSSDYDCVALDANGECLSIIFAANESEIIEVVFVDSYGCENILSINVNVTPLPPEIYIPNVFSPNQDGNNDFFTILSNKEDVIIESIYIYDRWGNLMYSEEEKPLVELNPWDGSYRGQSLNPGVYIYMINAIVEGELTKYTGDVTITK